MRLGRRETRAGMQGGDPTLGMGTKRAAGKALRQGEFRIGVSHTDPAPGAGNGFKLTEQG